LETDGRDKIVFLGGLTLPYEDEFRWRLLEASQHDVPLVEVLRLEKEITEHHLRATQSLLENTRIWPSG
jgi:anhydro-N-acetylmuramic acid kinase